MNRAAAVLRRIARSVHYRVRPAGYWNRRHEHHGHELDGAGLCGLGQRRNERDYRRKWEELSSLLERHGVERDATVLDAGCGPGWMTRRLLDAGFDVRGVDFSAEAVRLAREQTDPAVRFDVSPLSRYAPAGQFDAVCCIDVLFHVVDDREWTATVENLAELTKPSGMLVIQEHFDGEGGSGHVRWRDLADYRNALDGWELVEHVRYRLTEEGGGEGHRGVSTPELLGRVNPWSRTARIHDSVGRSRRSPTSSLVGPDRVRPVLFRWRGRPVHSYPVFLFAALAVGVTIAQAAAVARGLDQAAFLVALLAAVGPALLGTRLLYVAMDPGAPWSSVLRPGTGGSVLYGGLLGAGLVSLPVTILLGIPLGLFWDAVVYGMLAGIMVGRVGCLLHGCCVGRRTTGLLTVELPDHRGRRCPRFPARLAEIAWCSLMIGALFILERSGALARPGDIFFAGAGGYALGRFVLEFGRERRPSFIGPLTVSHAISILLILVSGSVFL